MGKKKIFNRKIQNSIEEYGNFHQVLFCFNIALQRDDTLFIIEQLRVYTKSCHGSSRKVLNFHEGSLKSQKVPDVPLIYVMVSEWSDHNRRLQSVVNSKLSSRSRRKTNMVVGALEIKLPESPEKDCNQQLTENWASAGVGRRS